MPQLYQMSDERLDRRAIDSRVAHIGLNIHGDVAVLFSMKWSALSGLAEQPSLVTTSGQAGCADLTHIRSTWLTLI
jgi:hypothetical protein